MNRRSIRATIRAIRRNRGAAMLAGLSDVLHNHAAGGEPPRDSMGQAFLSLVEAAQDAMDSSVGGGPEHDRACREFEGAYERWGQAVRESAL